MKYDARKMQDLKYSEKNLLIQYKQLWGNKNFDGINALLQSNPDLKYKIMDAFNWNRMINLINDQTNNNINIIDWSNVTTYNLHDLVTYSGFVWVSKQNNNIGNTPQLGDFWNKVDTIANAQGGQIAWENDETYNIYDIISYNGYMWVSKQNNNLNQTPQVGSNYWQQLYSTTIIKTATYDSLIGKWKIDYGDLKQITDEFKYIGEWTTEQEYKLGNLVKSDEQHTYFCLQNHTSSTDNQPPNSVYWMLAENMLNSVGIQVSDTPPTNLIVGDIYFQIIS